MRPLGNLAQLRRTVHEWFSGWEATFDFDTRTDDQLKVVRGTIACGFRIRKKRLELLPESVLGCATGSEVVQNTSNL